MSHVESLHSKFGQPSPPQTPGIWLPEIATRTFDDLPEPGRLKTRCRLKVDAPSLEFPVSVSSRFKARSAADLSRFRALLGRFAHRFRISRLFLPVGSFFGATFDGQFIIRSAVMGLTGY